MNLIHASRQTFPREGRGFTLIELVVVLAVVGVMLAAALPNISTWMQNLQIRSAAEAIQNGLQIARAEAVKRNANVQFVLTSVASSGQRADWSVTCVTAVADSDGDGSPDCPGAGTTPAFIQQFTANEGARNATVAATQSTITFNGVGRLTPTPSSALNISVTNATAGTCVASSGPMRCLNVAVTASGQIKMCDPAVSVATDSRKC